jgi:hypothetical protein
MHNLSSNPIILRYLTHENERNIEHWWPQNQCTEVKVSALVQLVASKHAVEQAKDE